MESESATSTTSGQEVDAISSSDERQGDVEGSSSTDQPERPEVVSLLNRLKAPRASDLARKRKVAANPPKGKRGCRGVTVAEPKNITALQRVKAFPDEPLCVSNSNACREEMSLKMSSVKNHIRCTKHEEGRRRLKRQGRNL